MVILVGGGHHRASRISQIGWKMPQNWGWAEVFGAASPCLCLKSANPSFSFKEKVRNDRSFKKREGWDIPGKAGEGFVVFFLGAGVGMFLFLHLEVPQASFGREGPQKKNPKNFKSGKFLGQNVGFLPI